jgi:sodium/bile acid cotransporter 7
MVLYLHETSEIDLPETYKKLTLQVIVPLVMGQITQKVCKPLVNFLKRHPHIAKRGQEWSLVFIVYTVFCKTFSKHPVSNLGQVFLMILFQLILLVVTMILAWFSLGFMTQGAPKTRVMGLFGCTHKTIALGVPLINSLYGTSDLVGAYTLPLLIWYPMQIILGSLLLKPLQNYITTETERWASVQDEAVEEKPVEEKRGVDMDEANREETEAAAKEGDLDAVEQGKEAKAM